MSPKEWVQQSALGVAPVTLDAGSLVHRRQWILGSHNDEPRSLTHALAFPGATLDRYP